MGWIGKWFITQNGNLINLDFFHAFTVEDDNMVWGHKDRNKFLFGSFKNRIEAEKYIELLKDKIIEYENQST